MKTLTLLIASALALIAQPTCTHVLRWAPQGAIQVWQQGRLTLAYTQSAPSNRTITPNGWNDQDQIVIFYVREIDNPGQIPPSHYSAPIQETQTCSGTQNPPPTPILFSRYVCQGSGTNADGSKWDCTGVEKWTLTTSSGTNTYAVSLDTDAAFVNLQPCPASDPTKACWQAQPITAQSQVPTGNWVALAPAYLETISASSSLITLPFDVARACVYSVESLPKMAVGSQFPLDGSMWDQNCVRFSNALPKGSALSIWY